MRVSKILIVCLALCLPGCLLQNAKLPEGVNFPNFNTKVVVDNDVRELTPKLVASLKDASKEDCLFLAKVWLGLADYMEHNNSITNTADLFPPKGVIVTIRDSYKWKVGSASEFTKITKEDMESEKGLNVLLPKEIDDTLRGEIVKTFRCYGNAALRAAEGK